MNMHAARLNLRPSRPNQRNSKKPPEPFSRQVEWECSENERQQFFLACPADEILYGGSAGGGKSDALIISSTGYSQNGVFDNPNWKALLLRRTFPELEKSIIRRSQYLFHGKGKYDANKHSWDFRPNGGILDFGHIKNDDDVVKYQSAEYNWIGFDELTHFSERMYLYLFSRLRTTDKTIHCKIRTATNPGGLGHSWVRKRFIVDKEPNLIYENEMTLPDGTKTSWSRCFIPSTVYDNKYLMKANPNYIRVLEELPDKEKRAFLYGDWEIFSGQFFQEFCEEHICDDFNIPVDWPQWVSMDYGFQSKCSIGFYTYDKGSDIFYRWSELYITKILPDRLAEMIKSVLGNRFTNLCGRYADKRILIKDEETGISTREKFSMQGIYFSLANDDRIEGWRRVRDLLAKDKEGKVHFKVFRSCKNFIELIPQMIHDENNVEDMEKQGETHIADELRYFAISRKSTESSREIFTMDLITNPITGYISGVNAEDSLLSHIQRLPGLVKGKNYFYDRID